MTSTTRTFLEKETALFMACMRELADAEKSGDTIRRFYALDEIYATAQFSETSRIRTRAQAELERCGFDSNQRPERIEPAQDEATDEAKLRKAVADLKRAGGLPDNCMVTLGPDGEPQIVAF
ncbi:hypothetical protein [Paracoccus sp. 22332]|uniref:hypothetical protein n=1 Tax=Paracoccus sp. 22332 TaxID=3453913 RepID=UPI003F84E3E5